MRITVDTAELRRRAAVHEDLFLDCGPSLAAHSLEQVLDVGQAAIGFLSGGFLYERYLQQTAALMIDAPIATARAAGQALALRGTAMAYEGGELGDPLQSFLGWTYSGAGSAFNLAGDAGDLVAHGVDIPTTFIPDIVLEDGPEKITEHTVDAFGNIKIFSASGEVTLRTETFEGGMVRVTVEIQADGGVGAKRLSKALGIEAGLTAGNKLYWDLPDAEAAERLKWALAAVLGGGIVAGPTGAMVAGAILRLPPPRGANVNTGVYAKGQGDIGILEAEGRASLTQEIGSERERDGTQTLTSALELDLELSGETDLPFFPAEITGTGTVTSRLEFENGSPSEIVITVSGRFATETEFMGVEVGPEALYEGKLTIPVDQIWDELAADLKRLSADSSRADDVIRRALQLGAHHSTATLDIYGGSRVEAELDLVVGGGSYEASELTRVKRFVLHDPPG